MLARWLAIWLASARYSILRQFMFRVDFFVWSVTDLAWMAVNLLAIEVVYSHVDSLAGWSRYEMWLLMGTSLVVMRLFTGLFLTNLYEFGRNVRSGTFDFFLTQPGHPLFLLATRKVELDGLLNFLLALGIVGYSALQLGIPITLGGTLAYGATILLSLAIHFSLMLLLASAVFWVVKSEGMENGYFTLMEFSRLPMAAYRGLANVIFVWVLPVSIASNIPAETLLRGPSAQLIGWLVAAAAFWFPLAFWTFHRGLRRYTSASS